MMTERKGNRPQMLKGVVATTLALALCVANSSIFIFIAWDQLAPSKPFTVILFFTAASAHFIYFFLPWFIKQMLAPIFGNAPALNRRFDERGATPPLGADGFLLKFSVQLGLVLCAASIGLWLLMTETTRPQPAQLAAITVANCRQIQGEPKLTDGKLICVVKAQTTAKDAEMKVAFDPLAMSSTEARQ